MRDGDEERRCRRPESIDRDTARAAVELVAERRPAATGLIPASARSAARCRFVDPPPRLAARADPPRGHLAAGATATCATWSTTTVSTLSTAPDDDDSRRSARHRHVVESCVTSTAANSTGTRTTTAAPSRRRTPATTATLSAVADRVGLASAEWPEASATLVASEDARSPCSSPTCGPATSAKLGEGLLRRHPQSCRRASSRAARADLHDDPPRDPPPSARSGTAGPTLTLGRNARVEHLSVRDATPDASGRPRVDRNRRRLRHRARVRPRPCTRRSPAPTSRCFAGRPRCASTRRRTPPRAPPSPWPLGRRGRRPVGTAAVACPIPDDVTEGDLAPIEPPTTSASPWAASRSRPLVGRPTRR